MRKIIAAAFTASLLAAGCATPDENTPPLSVVTVHDVPGKTKQQVCSQARDWAALTFKDSKAVVEVYDPVEGKMIGKGRMNVYAGLAKFPMDFTLMVECKDGRARATFDRFMVQSQYGAYPLRGDDPLNKLRTRAEAEARLLDASLAQHLAKSAADF